ncbi:MAG TPA: arginine deiminase family protein, partial [bacterium]|nr:arginine deiminase family protein [bacterium]
MPFQIASEIGRLREVIVHRPGIEISRLTPQNKESFLFDDILWVERAQEEHDRFVEILKSRGVNVLDFRTLLAETLADADVRAMVVDEVITPQVCGRKVSEYLRRELRACSMEECLDALLGGILNRELPEWEISPLFAEIMSNRFEFVLPPLPNLFFTRDSAAWINSGLILSVLATPARDRESLYLRVIYQHHPRFKGAGHPFWYGLAAEDCFPASIEGGDVLVLNEKTLVVGCGERTSAAAVETLAHRLFEAGGIECIIVPHFRRGRAIMHFDTVFTMVDVNKFNFYPGIQRTVDVFILRPGAGQELKVDKVDGIEPALRACLPRDDLQIIASGKEGIEYIREQWDDGHNTLAIAPGVVIGYKRNRETN